MRREALLAIVFAGGILNSQLPALSETETVPQTTDSVVQGIANNNNMDLALRAYYLLTFASSYLANGNRAEVEAQFARMANYKGTSWELCNSKVGDNTLVHWANRLSLEEHSAHRETSPSAEAKSAPRSISRENSALADLVVQKALAQLDKSSETFAKLTLYFIASQLFQKTGNTTGIHECNGVLDEAFKVCEGNVVADEEQVKALSAILNSMAFGFVPIHIPDLDPKQYRWMQQNQSGPFTEKDFKESEKLKLRSIALVDKLPSESHVRRKAHRDIVLWYMQLGKNELAEKEKQILFGLVDCKDDSILYPQHGTCGHLVWWVKTKLINNLSCGIG